MEGFCRRAWLAEVGGRAGRLGFLLSSSGHGGLEDFLVGGLGLAVASVDGVGEQIICMTTLLPFADIERGFNLGLRYQII
jgi:hypothetical protein